MRNNAFFFSIECADAAALQNPAEFAHYFVILSILMSLEKDVNKQLSHH